MKKTIILEELECAHCAAKMEAAVKELAGVENCSVNFLTQKMEITAADDKMDGILKEAEKIVKKIEPDVEFVIK
ncbi:MAG: heavy metal transporter [Lachnospiraceae bacterium]|nr:heavy metal transporter [Lachnospiraceae bacterium]